MPGTEKKTTFHSAASATANGTVANVQQMAVMTVQITGTFTTAVIHWEGTIDGTNWIAVQGVNLNSGAVATSASAAGLYRIPLAGLRLFRARLVWTAGTSITVAGIATEVWCPSLPDVELSAGSARVGAIDATIQVSDTDVSTTNPVPTSGFLDLIEVTLSLSTSQYASGDLLADTQEVATAFVNSHPAVLYSLQVIDEDDQAGAIDFLFLRSNQTMGTENSPFSPADAAAREILTEVPVVAADYNDYTNNQQAIKQVSDTGMGVVLKPTSGTSLYIAAISRDTKTYTAAGVRVRVGLVQAG